MYFMNGFWILIKIILRLNKLSCYNLKDLSDIEELDLKIRIYCIFRMKSKLVYISWLWKFNDFKILFYENWNRIVNVWD